MWSFRLILERSNTYCFSHIKMPLKKNSWSFIIPVLSWNIIQGGNLASRHPVFNAWTGNLPIYFINMCVCIYMLPWWFSGKESACQCRKHKRCRFDPWVWKISWRRAWQPTPVFFPGESLWMEEPGGLQSIGLQRVGHNWSNLLHMNDLWISNDD